MSFVTAKAESSGVIDPQAMLPNLGRIVLLGASVVKS